ncbi:EmrB/QacA family drug resistance transporter, partial [Escherichia coli]|nr:EmrB/QacA family drug resistance transporter [Escherichia coli]
MSAVAGQASAAAPGRKPGAGQARGSKAASGKAPGGHNPWLIAGVVALATFMEVLDTTIANVALRYI